MIEPIDETLLIGEVSCILGAERFILFGCLQRDVITSKEIESRLMFEDL